METKHYQQYQGIKPSIKQHVRVTIGGMFVNRSGCTHCEERNHNVYTCRHGGPITCVLCGLTGHQEKFCTIYQDICQEDCDSINDLSVFETVNRFDI